MAETSFSRSRNRWFLYAAVVLGIGVAVWYFGFRVPPRRARYSQPAWEGKTRPPLIPVRTVTAQAQDLPLHLKAIGTVTPLNTVTVRSRVSGEVLRVAFDEGQYVQAGQLLAEIDPTTYKIALAQAEGQFKQTAARLESARSDLVRTRDLHAKHLVPDQELDAAQALVAQLEGALNTDQARVDQARLQLTYTRITAPISGRTGLRRIDPGNLVRDNDTTGIVVITQTHPITVSFTIPEKDLTSVLDPFRAGQTLSVEAWDREESSVLANGVLKTIDNQIDTTTGTLKLKAEFANDDERLFPNQFINVRMHVGTLKHAIVIPSAAVMFGSRGTYVYVVNHDNKATVRQIVLGPSDGGQQAISKGLEPGDAVVLEGLDRLRDGRGVLIVNDTPAAAAGTAVAAP
jgi:multidrug efflux system membrane fusion protein